MASILKNRYQTKKAIGWAAYPADGLGNLSSGWPQAGPATMTSRIIMPTGIALTSERVGRPVKARNIGELKNECTLTSFPNASMSNYKFYLYQVVREADGLPISVKAMRVASPKNAKLLKKQRSVRGKRCRLHRLRRRALPGKGRPDAMEYRPVAEAYIIAYKVAGGSGRAGRAGR